MKTLVKKIEEAREKTFCICYYENNTYKEKDYRTVRITAKTPADAYEKFEEMYPDTDIDEMYED